MDRKVLKTYLDHFLPREVIGPVIIVFSLEGVISGLFGLYVPPEYETIAWGLIFLASVYGIAHWVTTGQAEEELEERIDDLKSK